MDADDDEDEFRLDSIMSASTVTRGDGALLTLGVSSSSSSRALERILRLLLL